MEIAASSSPVLLMQAHRLDEAREAVEAAQQATPAQAPAVVVELSTAARQLASAGGGSLDAA